jgi:hypothetical protein
VGYIRTDLSASTPTLILDEPLVKLSLVGRGVPIVGLRVLEVGVDRLVEYVLKAREDIDGRLLIGGREGDEVADGVPLGALQLVLYGEVRGRS